MRSCIFALLHLALFLGAAGAPVSAQNLLANPDFDSGITGWQVTGMGSSSWSMQDSTNTPNSGSVFLTNAIAAPGVSASILRQCIVIEHPSHVYRIGASGLTAGAVSGHTYVNWGFRYNSADCSGGGFAFGGLTYTTNNWTNKEYVLAYPTPLPTPTSIEVQLGVYKAAQGSGLPGYIDKVYVIADGIFASQFQNP